jgi:hypothetical protein
VTVKRVIYSATSDSLEDLRFVAIAIKEPGVATNHSKAVRESVRFYRRYLEKKQTVIAKRKEQTHE